MNTERGIQRIAKTSWINELSGSKRISGKNK